MVNIIRTPAVSGARILGQKPAAGLAQRRIGAEAEPNASRFDQLQLEEQLEQSEREAALLKADNESLQLELTQLRGKIELLEANIEEARAAAVQEGHADGVRTGEEEAHASAEAKLKLLDDVTEQMNHKLSSAYEAHESVICALVKVALRQLVSDSAADSAFREDVIKRSLDKVGLKDLISISLSPQDYQAFDGLVASMEAKGIRVFPDESIQAGCSLETRNGFWEATLDAQVQRVMMSLDG